MRRHLGRLLPVMSACLLACSSAQAARPAFKMSDLHFRSELGQFVSGTIELENRSDASYLITGWSLATPGGIKEFPSVGGRCMELRASHLPLAPGESCDWTLGFTPALPGKFEATACISTDPYPYPCSDVRGRVSSRLG